MQNLEFLKPGMQKHKNLVKSQECKSFQIPQSIVKIATFTEIFHTLIIALHFLKCQTNVTRPPIANQPNIKFFKKKPRPRAKQQSTS